MTVDYTTIRDLELDYIKGIIRELAVSPAGKEYIDRIGFLSRREEIEEEIRYIKEAVRIIQGNEDISLASLSDIRGHIARVRKGGVISGTEIREIGNLIRICREFRSFIRSRRDEYPSLYEKTAALRRYDELFSLINRTLDERGIIRDDCSPVLADLRQNVIKVREKIINIIDDFIRDPDTSKVLMDSYYSIRNNRFVLPVKTQFKNNIKGIIHGSSNTNETLFVEPESIINLGNEMVYAESLVIAEEEKVLRELSLKICDYSEDILRDYDILAFVDSVFARARYSMKIEGGEIRIGGRIDLIDVRHPILVLKNVGVVPNSILLEDGVRGVVISGPNAGGKTVLLKSIGLCALHLKLGLLFPISEKSTMPLFNSIYTCFGDAQNLAEGLSTFTGHIKRLNEILSRCGENDLVLLDEIASDTDPKEGSALSAAIIEAMIRRGAYVFVTTHFHELRHWASLRKDIINAAMGFDPVDLNPTFRVLLGVSGESYTLRIAQEMGIPEEIISRSVEILGREYQEYSKITAMLKERERELNLKIREIEEQKAGYEKERAEFIRRQNEEYEKRVSEFKMEKERLLSELMSFSEKVSNEIARIQRESDMKGAVSLKKEIMGFVSDIGSKDASNLKDFIEINIGDYVVVDGMNSGGDVVEVDSKKKRCLVCVNGKHIWMSLYSVRKGDRIGRVSKVVVDSVLSSNKYQGGQIEYEKSVDVRGLYLDDAISEVEKVLDLAYREAYSKVKIIHGHGTGSLKVGIRRLLRDSVYVSAFRPADLSEGGDGVTIVEIKRD